MVKYCKRCGITRNPHESHRCYDNRLLSGRSSYMIPYNDNYQNVVEIGENEYKAIDKPYIQESKFDYIVLNVRKNGIKALSKLYSAKTVEEIFEICSTLKLEYGVKYDKKFIHFEILEDTNYDECNDCGYIDEIEINFYKATPKFEIY